MRSEPREVLATVPFSERWETLQRTRSVRSVAATAQIATVARTGTTLERVLTTYAVPRPNREPMLMIM